MNSPESGPNNVPLIPIASPDLNGAKIVPSPRVRNSPTIMRGPIMPFPPNISSPLNTQGTFNLVMPNIGTPSPANRRNATRPLTSPVNLQRTPSIFNSSVVIPPNVSNRINSPNNYSSPLNIGESPIPLRPPILPIYNKPINPPAGIPTNNPIPVLSSNAITLNTVTSTVNSILASNIPAPAPEPLIKRENILPPSRRALSPRDDTEIKVNGISLDRGEITPINASDSETDEDVSSLIQLRNINTHPTFSTIVDESTIIDASTLDTTDGIIRSGPIIARVPDLVRNNPVVASPPEVRNNPVVASPPEVRNNSVVASPPEVRTSSSVDTGQINMSVPINLSAETIINPAPPSTTISTRVPTTRGRQPLPTYSQPTMGSNNLPLILGNTAHSPPKGQRAASPTRNVQINAPPTVQRAASPPRNIQQTARNVQPNSFMNSITPTNDIRHNNSLNQPLIPQQTRVQPQVQPQVPQQPRVQQTPLHQPQVQQPRVPVQQQVPQPQVQQLPVQQPQVLIPEQSIKISDTQIIPSTLSVLPSPNVPKYSAMTLEEQAQHRAHFRARFGILRTAWPNYHIPDIPDTLTLEEIHAQYDIYVRHIHISRDVDQYKVYLVIMWLIIELACTKIGLNIGGYTVSQMRSMNKYERLLIELGETNYKSSATEAATAQSSWPVEVRILFIALVNAVTFIIIKMLASYIGEGMATTIVDGLSSYLSGAPPQPGQVLFGGPTQNNIAAPGSSVPNAGPSPLPQMGGPFGGLDIASMLANFGTNFIRGQAPTAGATAPAPIAQMAGGPQTPNASRFAPAYAE